MQRSREKETKRGVSVSRGHPKEKWSENSPIGSARTGGRRAHGRVGQQGIQRMNLVELAFRHSVKIVRLSAAPVALTHRR